MDATCNLMFMILVTWSIAFVSWSVVIAVCLDYNIKEVEKALADEADYDKLAVVELSNLLLHYRQRQAELVLIRSLHIMAIVDLYRQKLPTRDIRFRPNSVGYTLQ